MIYFSLFLDEAKALMEDFDDLSERLKIVQEELREELNEDPHTQQFPLHNKCKEMMLLKQYNSKTQKKNMIKNFVVKTIKHNFLLSEIITLVSFQLKILLRIRR